MTISDLAYLEDVSEGTSLTGSSGYYVRPGDTLSEIAESAYGNGGPSCYNAIAAYNGIPDPNHIEVEDKIYLPFGLC